MQLPKDLFATLPVELLYQVHFFAASEALPLTCRRLHDIFKNASPTVHADYLIARYISLRKLRKPSIITYVLRFPLCTPSILAALLERPSFPHPDPASSNTNSSTNNTGTHASRDHHHHQHYADYGPPELPRRLFRQLSPSGAEALPLLRFLYTSSAQQLTRPPDANSHNGYALARAVAANAVPLVHFLLDHGAAPRYMDALAIRIAIGRRDLALVRLLIERRPETPADGRRTGKRRKLADRIQVTSEMLRLAVLCDAHDIVEYFMKEKGSVPDIETLKLLRIVTF